MFLHNIEMVKRTVKILQLEYINSMFGHFSMLHMNKNVVVLKTATKS